MTLTQITEKGIKDGEIINADINASAAIAGSKIAPDFGSQNIATTGTVGSGDITISGTAPRLILTDSNNDSDFRLNVDAGLFSVQDTSNSFASRLEIGSDGKFRVGCTAQPSSSVGGFQLDMGSYPGTARISSGAGASGTDTASIQIAGSNYNASLAHGANSGAALNLINYNTTDGNSTSVSFHNSNSLASARVLGVNISHSDRHGALVFMTADGIYPVEHMRLNHLGNLGIGTDNPSGGKLHIHSGTSNTCATFESSDAGAVINLTDSHTRSSIEQNNTDLKIIADTGGTHANSTIKFQVDGSTKQTINNNGNVLIGTTSSANVASSASAFLQVEVDSSGIPASFYSTVDASGPAGVIGLGHGRGSIGGALQDNDIIGQIRFAGGDGTDCQTHGAEIRAEVNGTPSSNNMPADLVFYTNGGAVSTGERVRILKAGGMTFNGDTSTSNALDDYEEGTFTPTVYGAGTAGDTISYIYQSGKYTKVGNLVNATIIIAVNSIDNATGDFKIGGLPFGHIAGSDTVSAVQYNSLGSGLPSGREGPAFALVQGGYSVVNQIRVNDSGTSNTSPLQIQTIQYIRFTLTYPT